MSGRGTTSDGSSGMMACINLLQCVPYSNHWEHGERHTTQTSALTEPVLLKRQLLFDILHSLRLCCKVDIAVATAQLKLHGMQSSTHIVHIFH